MTELGVPEDRIIVIPNGVDSQKFYPIPKFDARKRLALPDGRILLSVASLTANKGLDLLIKAFGRVLQHSHDKNYLLVIAGEGVMRRDPMGQAQERMTRTALTAHHA
jgi:glycosyltransferase involved in cell wall biosynthesis